MSFHPAVISGSMRDSSSRCSTYWTWEGSIPRLYIRSRTASPSPGAVVTTLDATGFAAYSSPIMVGLAVTVWAAVLGLTALLVGTLFDARAA